MTNNINKLVKATLIGLVISSPLLIVSQSYAGCKGKATGGYVDTAKEVGKYQRFETWEEKEWGKSPNGQTYRQEFAKYHEQTYNQLQNINSNLNNVLHGDAENTQKFNAENIKIEDGRARVREAERMILENKLKNRPSLASCSSATRAVAATGGGRGSGKGPGQPSMATVAKLDDNSKKYLTSVKSEAKRVGEAIMSKSAAPNVGLKTCTEADYDNQIPGCPNTKKEAELKDVKSAPGADTEIKNVRQGAVNTHPTNSDTKAKKSNYTIIPADAPPAEFGSKKPKQEAIARAVVNDMITTLPPPMPSQMATNSPEGAKWIAMRDMFNTRASAIYNNGNTEIADSLGGYDDDAKKDFEEFTKRLTEGSLAGDKFEAIYERLFPGQLVPDPATSGKAYTVYPSKYELLRFDIYRRYVDMDPANSWYVKVGSAAGDDLTRESLYIQSQQSYMMLKMMEAQDRTNRLLSAILAQSLNPVNAAQIKSIADQLNVSSK